jgi:peroxiredoxin/mono/diheme cytochrome c family protein
MPSAIRKGLVLSAALIASTGLQATSASSTLAPGDRIDDFRLLDHVGKSHRLYYLSDTKAVVLIAHGSCPAMAATVTDIKKLREKYAPQSVEFLMIDSTPQSGPEQIAAAAKKQGIDLPILMDKTQLIGESLGVRNAGEVLVVDPKGWKLVYRGNAQSTAPALDAVLAGVPVKTASTKVTGCDIAMPEAARRTAHAGISYEKTIAPMLIDNCITCHRDGGIGPWQMSSYEMIKGFAPMIREVIRTERMPPWHADPHHGEFSNDRALSDAERKTLVHWIEAGAPRGAGPDPLAQLKRTWPEWALGKPDLVLELPAFEVPATGVVPYQDVRVKNTVGRDVWLKAIDYAPGDRTVVHHILGYTLPPGAPPIAVNDGPPQQPGQPSARSVQLAQACSTPAGAERIRTLLGRNDLATVTGGSSIAGYVPGAAPAQFPADTGVLIKKESDFRFQIHYTPTGKTSTDVTRVSLYFTDAAPKYPLRNTVLMDPCLTIPANNKAHTASMSRMVERDMYIYSLTPHSHFRGAASNFIAEYPNGTQEILLSVPKYDFNWQTAYALAQPKLVPKGTKLTHNTTYDNSALNKANPDHNVTVHWGEQSWEEMLYGSITMRYADEVTSVSQNVPAQP